MQGQRSAIYLHEYLELMACQRGRIVERYFMYMCITFVVFCSLRLEMKTVKDTNLCAFFLTDSISGFSETNPDPGANRPF